MREYINYRSFESQTIRDLYEMALRFGFRIDTRGIYPIMIKGQCAKTFYSRRDAYNFIAKTHPVNFADDLAAQLKARQ
jgi:hypothetical protein